MRLTRLSPRGRKRTKPRVEELVRISVHSIVTNRGGPHTIFDKNGTKLQFVDEAERDGRMVLRVYQNSNPILTYQLAEKPIGGQIKSNAVGGLIVNIMSPSMAAVTHIFILIPKTE